MKIMIYDIETLPVHARIWRPGDQVVRHGQLIEGHDHTQIICIQYCINDGPVKVIKRDLNNIEDELRMIEEFDELVRQCDIVIGKNSDRFDNKHINTIRMLAGGRPVPDWTRYTDDLEKQMKKYFNLPSNALDYISHKLGFGGKEKMVFSDWVEIDKYFTLLRLEQNLGGWSVDNRFKDQLSVTLLGKPCSEIRKEGNKALKKMYKYGAKDTADTRKVWNYCKNHFEPKAGSCVYRGEHVCQRCGSSNIIPDKERPDRLTTFYCKDHKGYAGRAKRLIKGGYGKML